MTEWQDDYLASSVQAAHAIIDEAIRLYQPVAVVGLFSGGHDSLTACHVAAQHPAFTGCLHIGTGIGIPETEQFVVSTCERERWDLGIYRAVENTRADGTPDPQVWEDMVREYGFPGPGMHWKMYNRLKERPLRMFVREVKKRRSDKVLLISGCRSDESVRRMGNVEPIQKDGARIWCAVIHDWTKEDCNRYLAANAIQRNPVVDRLCKSGECLCGAFAKRGELTELAAEYPEVAARIRALEAEVADRFPWGWEGRPTRDHLDRSKGQQLFEFMCTDCKASAGEY